jgi:glycosyltransferase involved in cell wall biosynthesis
MRIIYIHQHFVTNEGTGGTRSYDVSKYLVEMGHEVTMICGINNRSGLKPMRWYQPFRRERIDGIDVIVCNVDYANRMGAMRRLAVFFGFAFMACIASLFAGPADLVFATSTPLTVGIPGYIVSRIKRAAFVFEVRDLWPEDLVLAGYVQPGLMVSLAERLERFIYRTSQKVLLVSPGFEKRLRQRGYPPSKLRTHLLGADGSLFVDLKADEAFLERTGLKGKVVAAYTGAHGVANGLDYILDAAKCLEKREDIAIILIGEGMEKPRLIERAEEMGLTNVQFIDPVLKTVLPGVLAGCEIGLMILSDIGERPVTPNKIFDYMFVGLPSIVNFPGPTLDMVLRDGTGVEVDAKDPGDLARAIEDLADQPERRREMGQRARQMAFEKYTRQAIAEQLSRTFQEVLDGRRCGPASHSAG